MKKIYAFILSIAVLFTSYSQNYTITTGLPNNIISGSGTTITGLGDDNYVGPFNIGFNFTFFNSTQTQFYMAANGSITFSYGDGSVIGTIPSTSTPNNFIAFASTDQYPGASSSPILNYFISGSSPNRILVINYQNIRHYSNSSLITSVQLQLFENSGKIEIHNIQNNSGGIYRTIGIENSTGTAGFSPTGMNYTSTISLSNQMIRFSTCTPPAAPVISPSSVSTICTTNPSVTLSASCPSGILSWSNGATTSAISFSPTQTTTYTATCAENGCQTSSNISVPVLQVPTVSPNGTNYICTGNTLTLTATSTTSGVGFQWYKDGSSVQGATNSTILVNAGGSYSVTVSKDACLATSTQTVINENSTIPDAPNITPIASYTCPGVSIQLTANNCTGTIDWSNGQTGSIISYLPSQDYSTLTATCNVNGCTSNVSNTYTNVIAKVSITAPNTTICPGGSVNISSILTVSSTVTYEWLLNGNPISLATNNTYSPNVAGSYSVRVVYPSGCIITSSPVTINVTNSIQPLIYACGTNQNTPVNKIWDNVPSDTYPSILYQNDDNTYFLGGSKYVNSSVNYQGTFEKIDSKGNLVFSKEFGDYFAENVKKILKTNDGNYLLGISRTPYSYSSSISDYRIIKTDPNGIQIFAKSYAGGYNNSINSNLNQFSVVIKSGSGYLVGGVSNANIGGDKSENSINNSNDFWIIKTDENGNKLWDKSYGGTSTEDLSSILELTDGYLLAGTSSSGINGNKTSSNYGNSDFWLVKIDLDGNKLWDKSYGGTESDFLTKIVANADGTFILAGNSLSGIGGNKTVDSRGQKDFWIVKIAGDGTKIWDKRFGGSLDDQLNDISILTDGSIILSGFTFSSQNGDVSNPLKGNNGYTDYWVIKADANGNKIWDKNYGSSNPEYLYSTVLINDNELLLAGYSNSGGIADNDKSTQDSGTWLLKVKACEELPNPTYINSGQQIRLVAAGCPGAIVWNNGNTNIEINVSPNITTTYSVSCASNNNCITTQSYQVNVNCSNNFTVTAQGNNLNPVICNSSPSVILEATGCSGNILWNGGATSTSISVSPTITGTYSATCSGSSCSTVTKTINVTYIANPVITASGNTSVCVGQVVGLTATTNVTGGTIQWYLDGNSIVGANALTYSATATGAYSFKVLKDGCEATSNTINVTVNTVIPPKPILTASSLYSCGRGYPINLTVSGCNGTVNWFNSNTSLGYWNGTPSGTTASAGINGKVKFYVSCTENVCTSIVSDTIFADFAKIVLSTQDNLICNGGNVLLNSTITPNNGIIGYQWQNGFSDIIGATNNSYTATTASTFNLIVTFSNGCTLGSYSYIGGSNITLQNATVPSPNILLTDNSKTGSVVKAWDKRYGGNDSESIATMIKVSNNSYLLGGSSRSYFIGGDRTQDSRGQFDYWIVKIDSSGNKIWDKRFGGISYEYLYDIKQTSNKDILQFGTSNSDISGDKTMGIYYDEYYNTYTDIWVVKTDSSGNKKWDKKYGGNSSETISNVLQLPDNQFIIAGSTSSEISGEVTEGSRGNTDYWIVKIDSAGTKLWDKRYGGSGNDGIQKIIKTNDGNYILAGSSNSDIGGDKSEASIGGSTDIWLLKIDPNGNKIWNKTIGTSSNDIIKDLVSDNNGDLIISAEDNNLTGYLYKLNLNGSLIWSKSYSNTYLFGNLTPNNKGILLTGTYYPYGGTFFSSTPRGNLDGYIIQFDSTGNKISDMLIGSTGTDGFNTVLSVNNDLFIGGSSDSPIAFDKSQLTRGATDFWLTKINFNKEITQPASINSGQSINLIANNCPGTITWSGGTTATGALIIVAPTVPTTYTATCSAYGCSTSSNITININCSSNFVVVAKDNNGLVFPNPSVCNESPSVNLEATGCLGAITWSNGTTGSTITVSPIINTTFTATCSDAGCTSVISSVQVKTFETPTITAVGPTTFCIGSSVILNATVTGSGYSFQWYKDGSTINNLTNTITVNQSGSYQVLISKNGCSAISSGTPVNVNSTIPAAPTYVSDSLYLCLNTTVQLVANGCTNGLVTWSNGNTGSAISYTHNIVSMPVYFTSTCKINGCISNTSSQLNILNASSNILNNSTEYICVGGSVLLNAKQKNGVTYQWVNNSGDISGATSANLNVNMINTYQLKTNYYTNCEVTSTPVSVETISILPISTAMTSTTKDTLFKVWDKVYGGTSSDFSSQIIKVNNGEFLILGSSTSQISGNKTSEAKSSLSDFWLVKVNSDGIKIWDKTYGGNSTEIASRILKTNDNGYLLIGQSGSGISFDKSEASLGGWDIWIIKIDENGNKVWDKTIGSALNDDVTDAKILADGSFVIVGPSRSLDNNNVDYQIIKVSGNGNVIWQKIYTGDAIDNPYGIIQTNDNGFLVSGSSNSGISNDKTSPSNGGYDFWLIKLNENGNKIWDKSYGGNGSENNINIIKTNDNYFYLAGNSSSNISGNKSENSRGGDDYWVIKIDENGDKIWDKTMGGIYGDYLTKSISTLDNGIIMGGYTNSNKSGDIIENQIGNSTDMWLVKLNESGNKVWNKRIGGNGSDTFTNFYLEEDNLFVLGSSESNISGDKTFPSWNNSYCQNNYSCSSDIWLLKYLLKNPQPSPAPAKQGRSISLVASNCQGNVIWSNGMSGARIEVTPIGNTIYTATCNAFGCSTNSTIVVNLYSCDETVILTQTNNILTGTSNTPVVLKAFETINATNTIGQPPTNAAAKYAAGKSINLNPGFKVEIGSVFQAKISTTPCNE